MGDVITKVDDRDISTMEDLNAAKKQYSAGDTVTLTVYRQGETITLSLTWDSTPAQAEDTEEDQSAQSNESYGGQYGGGFSNPSDLFEYFFGNR